MKYKFVKTNCKDIYWNFALEEYMLDNIKKDEFVLYLWRNTKSVLIGRNQNVYEECKLEAMNRDNVSLIRRRSGGGAVYFDLGNSTYSFISEKENFSIDWNFNFVISALRSLGFDTERSGRNDILYEGKKISGNAFYNTGNKSLHHGTILLNVDLSDMSKYLNVSKKKLESKGVKSVRSRVINLIEYDKTLTHDKLVNAFYDELCKITGEKIDTISLEDLQKDEKLRKYYEKHKSNEWQLGKNPEFNHRIGDRFDWGEVDFRLLVKGNRIKNIEIYTDSLVPDYFDKMKSNLLNTEYTSEEIRKVLKDSLKIYTNEKYKKIFEDIKDLFAKNII